MQKTLLRRWLPCAWSLLTAMAGTAAVAGESPEPAPYRILTTKVLGGGGGWDLLSVDADARRLYVARGDRVMVVDADTAGLIGEIPGAGVHGVAVVPRTDRGFITNGNTDEVTVFALSTRAVIARVATGKKPDAIAWDPATDRVFVCDNGGNQLTVLAPDDGHVLATIDLAGAPELVALDGDGRLYTNLEDLNQVAVVDTRTLKPIAAWPLAPGTEPTGIAVDAKHHRVFSACRGTKTLQVLDADGGALVASVPIGAGSDGAVYDDRTDEIVCPNGDGTITVIHEDDPRTFRVAQTLPTRAGARTIALDAKTRRLFTVTADRSPDGAKDANGWPRYVDGTFAVLVVGR